MVAVSDDGSGGGMAGDIPPVLTGSDGTFTVGGLRKGSYDVTAEGLKGGARGTTADVAVEHGPVDTRVTIVALGSIAGVVTTAGKPVVDYRIAADSDGPGKRRTIHADDGAYKLAGLDPGHYTVTATSEQGTGSVEVDVKAGQTAQAPITIVGDAHVQGRFVDTAGAPLADRMVLVTPRQAPGSMMINIESPPPRTAADGTFSVATPAGARTLLILGEHGPELQKDLDVSAGQQLDLGTIKAEPPGPPQQAQGSGHKPAG